MDLSDETICSICRDIAGCASLVRIEPINKGVSGDRKYDVETAEGGRFLLRISDGDSYSRKKTMYGMMERAAASGVAMSYPVAFGVCNYGALVCQLLSWCEGETAADVLPSLPVAVQYELGLKAGRNLRLIHTIPAPEGQEDWYDCFTRINDGRLQAFAGCGISVEGSDAVLSYYESNRHLLRGRPQCFIHGDYHNENLLVSSDNEIAVVDWELLDSLYGDPWSEFTGILSTTLIPSFAAGLLDGYFGGEPPAEFWPVLALYLSAGALMQVSWAFYVQPEFLEECRQTAQHVLRWFDNMHTPVPSWYRETKRMMSDSH